MSFTALYTFSLVAGLCERPVLRDSQTYSGLHAPPMVCQRLDKTYCQCSAVQNII